MSNMNKDKAMAAILKLREAMSAVRECGTDVECWIVKDISLHIEELQNEIRGEEYE